jgi:hypothetical protein
MLLILEVIGTLTFVGLWLSAMTGFMYALVTE